MDEPSANPVKPKRQTNRKRGLLYLAIIVVAVIIGISLSGGGSKAKYSASSTDITVVDPATVSVSFQVTNNGQASGQPNCTINVQDPNYKYTGTDEFKLSDSIAPGQTTNSADSITVTKQGAQYVTSAKVSCN